MTGRVQGDQDGQLIGALGGWHSDALEQQERDHGLVRFPRDDMARLYHRIVQGRGATGRGVAVVVTSPQPRAGVTSVVQGLGRVASERSHRRVLLCDGSAGGDLLRSNRMVWHRGIGALADSKSLLGPGLVACALHGDEAGGDSESGLQELRGLFDLVLLDVPAVDSAGTGLHLACCADTTVVVVEAERTRLPMAADLAARIRAAGGNVAGIVINRRRKHIPERVYRWLW